MITFELDKFFPCTTDNICNSIRLRSLQRASHVLNAINKLFKATNITALDSILSSLANFVNVCQTWWIDHLYLGKSWRKSSVLTLPCCTVECWWPCTICKENGRHYEYLHSRMLEPLQSTIKCHKCESQMFSATQVVW